MTFLEKASSITGKCMKQERICMYLAAAHRHSRIS